MKQKTRYRRKRKGAGLVGDWPEGRQAPTALSARVKYVGAAEHKWHPIDASFDISPALRSDASKCGPELTKDTAQNALSRAVAQRCVSQAFDGEFPRYAWGRIDGHPYVARLTNRGAGEYKGWPLEEFELPTDRDGRLKPSEWEEEDV